MASCRIQHSHTVAETQHIFSTPIEPAGIHITPLWECGMVLTAYQHSKPGRFISFSLEDPEHFRVLGSSFQSVAAALLIDLWEDEASDEALRDISRLFEFCHLDRLLRECESRSRSETPADYDAWRTAFLRFCEHAV
jgi:hypothetical protein